MLGLRLCISIKPPDDAITAGTQNVLLLPRVKASEGARRKKERKERRRKGGGRRGGNREGGKEGKLKTEWNWCTRANLILTSTYYCGSSPKLGPSKSLLVG